MSDQATGMELAGQKLHFVGIGGCGMSGLARMARQAGATVTGSDRAGSAVVDALRAEGFNVALEQTADAVPADAQVLVISAAIKPEHPEVVEANRRGLRVIKYAKMLGLLMADRTGIAVAGTHGKSTTTSMLSHALICCGLDPSLIVGANCQQIGGGWRVGQSELLVAEACEFDRSFHNLRPEHAVVLNVEADHMDVYSSLDEIVESFAEFARKLPDTGSLLVHHEMPHRLALTAALDCDVQTIGFAPQADWRVEVVQDEQLAGRPRDGAADEPHGGALVRLYHDGRVVMRWRSAMPGEHMAYNAAVAGVLAHRVGGAWDKIAEALENFAGLDRRMQRLGVRPVRGGSAVVVDDYGHHPTEIDTTLRALRQHYRPRRLVCVFQPHQHSRTRFLMEQFAASFAEADLVIVPHIYFVRDSEQERQAVTAGDLVDRLRKGGVQAMHLYPFDAIVEQLEVIAQDGDLLVTMGAGDVYKVARQFLASAPTDAVTA